MKALMKTKPGHGNVEIVDMPEPVPNEGLVKIRVVYSGICATDLHSYEGLYAGTKPPVVLGHEFSGVVAEVGPGVASLKPGDRVTSETTFTVCGKCVFCEREEYNLCSNRTGIGSQVNGSFAEYMLARGQSVHKLPDNVSLLSAALTEPLACCVHGCLERTSISKGDVVLVMGPGPIGFLAGMVAASQGAVVILSGVSADKDRLRMAEKLGIHRAVNQQEEDLAQVTREMTNGLGPSPVIECSGNIKALNTALQLAAKQADIVQMGLFAQQYNEIDTGAFFPKELRLVGSRTQKPSSWRTSIKLMGDETITPEKLVTDIIPLENWRDGFQEIRDKQGIKTVFQLSSE
jgi:L-iditol 2-dehydrogenase